MLWGCALWIQAWGIPLLRSLEPQWSFWPHIQGTWAALGPCCACSHLSHFTWVLGPSLAVRADVPSAAPCVLGGCLDAPFPDSLCSTCSFLRTTSWQPCPGHTHRGSVLFPEQRAWHVDWVISWSSLEFGGSAMTSRFLLPGCSPARGLTPQGLCLGCGFLATSLSSGPGWSRAGLEPPLPSRDPSSSSSSGFQVAGALPGWGQSCL